MATITIKKATLEEWQQLEAERKALNTRKTAIETRQGQIEADVEQQLRAAGKKSATRYGFRLCLVQGSGRVAWKDAYVRECGADKAAALTAEAKAKAPESLRIDVPDPSPQPPVAAEQAA